MRGPKDQRTYPLPQPMGAKSHFRSYFCIGQRRPHVLRVRDIAPQPLSENVLLFLASVGAFPWWTLPTDTQRGCSGGRAPPVDWAVCRVWCPVHLEGLAAVSQEVKLRWYYSLIPRSASILRIPRSTMKDPKKDYLPFRNQGPEKGSLLLKVTR